MREQHAAYHEFLELRAYRRITQRGVRSFEIGCRPTHEPLQAAAKAGCDIDDRRKLGICLREFTQQHGEMTTHRRRRERQAEARTVRLGMEQVLARWMQDNALCGAAGEAS